MSSSPSHATVTYTSMSSDNDVPSWGIPLMDAYESDPEAPEAAPQSVRNRHTFTSSCSYGSMHLPPSINTPPYPTITPINLHYPGFPSPTLRLPPASAEIYFRADMPPQKRARFAAPSHSNGNDSHVSGSDEEGLAQGFDKDGIICSISAIALWNASEALSEIKKMETELWNLVVKGTDYSRESDGINPKRFKKEIELNKKLDGSEALLNLLPRQLKFKRKMDKNSRNNHVQQPLYKRHNVAKAYVVGLGENREYAGTLPLFNKCKFYHNGSCTAKCTNYKRVGHLARYYRSPTAVNTQRAPGANQNCGNAAGNGEARGRAYALGGCEPNPDLNDAMSFWHASLKRKTVDKSEEKRPEDVPVVRDFLVPFWCSPSASEFQIDLVKFKDNDLEEDQEDDGDDRDTFNIRTFTPLIPTTLHTTPPNEDYVAPATKPILDELLEEKILNVAMVDEEADPTRDLEEPKRLLVEDPHFTKIQVPVTKRSKSRLA
ncbi:hypothetical protein Tco_0908606 [Tanacetum coccineum]|uniref:Uncharacterized protein n=1 Tax=Tanacetum coccineum TaxID=301880 RepID=A0ABQ5CMP8_9ASTR